MVKQQSRLRGSVALLGAVVTLAAWPAAWGEIVTITVDGDKVEFSYDERYVTLQGNVVITGQSEEDEARRVRIEADFVEGDLVSGRFDAVGDVLVVTPEVSLRGESVHYEASTSEFRLKRAGAMVALRKVAGQKVCGYAYGREVGRQGDILYIVRGRFTTCDRPDPHFALECKGLVYHLDTGKVIAKGGALRLYGVKIPLLPRVSFNIGREEEEKPVPLLLPSYSGRDGLYLRWAFPLTGDQSTVEADLHLRVTSKRGLRGQLQAETGLGAFTGRARATWKEDVSNDLDELVSISRLPEVSVEREWQASALGGTRLSGGLTLGRYRELGAAGEPDVKDQRAMTELRLAHNDDQWAAGAGKWWWIGARQMWYDGGDHYTDVEVAMGAGTRLSAGLTGSVTARHHAIGGETPFEFDDVDIETELMGRAQATLGNGWGLGLLGRFDLQADNLRDYQVELRKRAHCLTWVAGYRDVGDRLSVGVEVNGLWGNTESYPQRPIERGPPCIWGEEQAATGQGAVEQSTATE